tara:strand:+ start:988 stop:1119 length:132 start_codon:yes stop_codon:yes gene_type:complete
MLKDRFLDLSIRLASATLSSASSPSDEEAAASPDIGTRKSGLV